MSDEDRPTEFLHMRNPPNWKDWITALGTLVTIAVVLMQGGRILESQDNMKLQLNGLVGVVSSLKEEGSVMKTEMASQKGVDALHAEQIKNLRDQFEAAQRMKRGQ